MGKRTSQQRVHHKKKQLIILKRGRRAYPLVVGTQNTKKGIGGYLISTKKRELNISTEWGKTLDSLERGGSFRSADKGGNFVCHVDKIQEGGNSFIEKVT